VRALWHDEHLSLPDHRLSSFGRENRAFFSGGQRMADMYVSLFIPDYLEICWFANCIADQHEKPMSNLALSCFFMGLVNPREIFSRGFQRLTMFPLPTAGIASFTLSSVDKSTWKE